MKEVKSLITDQGVIEKRDNLGIFVIVTSIVLIAVLVTLGTMALIY